MYKYPLTKTNVHNGSTVIATYNNNLFYEYLVMEISGSTKSFGITLKSYQNRTHKVEVRYEDSFSAAIHLNIDSCIHDSIYKWYVLGSLRNICYD